MILKDLEIQPGLNVSVWVKSEIKIHPTPEGSARVVTLYRGYLSVEAWLSGSEPLAVKEIVIEPDTAAPMVAQVGAAISDFVDLQAVLDPDFINGQIQNS